MKRIRKKKNKSFKIVLLFTCCICLAVVYKRVSLNAKNVQYQKQIEELEGKIEEENKRAEQLESYEEYVKSDKYIEEIARQKLGLVYEDEIIFEAEED